MLLLVNCDTIGDGNPLRTFLKYYYASHSEKKTLASLRSLTLLHAGRLLPQNLVLFRFIEFSCKQQLFQTPCVFLQIGSQQHTLNILSYFLVIVTSSSSCALDLFPPINIRDFPTSYPLPLPSIYEIVPPEIVCSSLRSSYLSVVAQCLPTFVTQYSYRSDCQRR